MEGLLSRPIGETVSWLIREICTRHDLGQWTNEAFDGVADPNTCSETKATLDFCGLVYTLQSRGRHSQVPVQLRLEKKLDQLHYDFRIGHAELDLSTWTTTKLWKQVYLLCHGELRDPWRWEYSVSGLFADESSPA